MRQAKTLVKFAQTSSDPQVMAALIQKANDLKSHIEEEAPDLSAKAPDVEPPS
jgi:ribosomal protein S15P/S13E